jgi:hypothetical protein
MAIFIDFDPLNPKTEKNELDYHAGKVCDKNFPKHFFSKKLILTSL